jgi:Icc-related predicted phosphoesterase
MTGDNTNATIAVVDITGRMVYSEKVNVSTNFKKDIQLNVENGQYIISVVDETSVVTRKIQVIK